MGHEDFEREQRVDGSSNRVFGLVFGGFFLLIALWPLLGGGSLRYWALPIGAAFAIVALIKPTLLAPFNRLWMKLGVLLGKIVSPVALGILFFVVFTPMGALIRLMGKDPLRLRRDRASASYWIERLPPGPPPDSLGNQF